MSKLGKVLLGTAAPLILAGGVLAFVGWRMGGETRLNIRMNGHVFDMSPFGISDENWFYGGDWFHGGMDWGWSTQDEPWRDWTDNSVSEPELADFQRLEVDLPLGDLTVETGDGPSLYMNWSGRRYQLYYTNENGLLKIWGTGMEGLSRDKIDAYVTLTLPEGTRLEQVSVDAAVGDTELLGLSIGGLSVDSDVGDVTLSGLTLGTGDLNLDVGSLYAELDLKEKLTVDSKVGDVNVAGMLAGDLDLTANLGTIYVSTGLPASNYRWDLGAGLGGIWLGDEYYDRDNLSGGSGEHELNADADIGDVNVTFGGGWSRESTASGEDVTNLPQELYASHKGLSAEPLTYDFTVEETTLMTIDVEHISGVLGLGIKNKGGFNWAYGQREFGTESATVELAPGAYSLVIEARAFEGSYHLTGETI